jgi:hypothetical protein
MNQVRIAANDILAPGSTADRSNSDSEQAHFYQG